MYLKNRSIYKNQLKLFKLTYNLREYIMTSHVSKVKISDSSNNNSTVNLIKRFNVFLEDHKVEGKNVDHTHTAFGPPWGKFMVPDDEYDDYMNLYSKISYKTPLYITERPREVGPLILDVDFKFDGDHADRQYTQKDVTYVIDKYNSIVRRYYSATKKDLRSFVSEKDKPSYDAKKNQYKDGWHVIWPNIPVSTGMRYLIRDEVLKEIEEEGGFDHLEYINTMDDIIDKCIIESNGWMMYGSQKYKGSLYNLTHIYKYDTSKTVDVSKFSNKELPSILSNRKFTVNDELKIKPSVNVLALNRKLERTLLKNSAKSRQQNMQKQIKLSNKSSNKPKNSLFSNSSSDEDGEGDYDENVVTDDDDDDDKVEPYNKYDNLENYDDDDANHDDFIKRNIMANIRNKQVKKLSPKEEEISLSKKLVSIMSKERANDFHKWIRVGWALKTIDARMLESFKTFSKKCPQKYDEAYCEDVWDKAREAGYTIKALHRWAKDDNPGKYTEIIRGSINNLVAEAETGTENDIAKLIYQLYKHCFVCSSIKFNIWYEFQEHSWVEVESGYTLKNKISDELTKEFASMNSYYYALASTANGQDRDTLLKRGDNVMKIILKLKKSGFKKSVLEECTNLFYDKKFEEKLDSNPFLIGYDNGVYDLKNECFREGVPEDYVTFTVGYAWKDFKETDPMITEIKDFFKSVMVDKDMREYILTLLASYLDGLTKQQKFILWTGSGSNGKSKMVYFFNLAFGDYCDTLPITVLTKKQGNASSASPEVAKLRGKRFVCFQEPESDDKIYVGRMKELTGGDKIHARPLFREPIVFKPQFKLLLTCNKLPFIPSTDGGTWRRLRVSPWESEFVDLINGLYNGKAPKANQFVKDYDLDDKLERWKQAFMWLLVTKYYKKYNKEGLVEPKKVTEFTNKYQKDSDIYFEFLSEVLISTESKKDYESMSVIYNFFKDWYRECYATSKCPSKKDLSEYMENHDYVFNKGYVYNVKFANDDEVDAELDD